MERTLFPEIVDKYFKMVIGQITEKFNDLKTEPVLLHKTMLTEEYSADLSWGSTDLNHSIVAADVVSLESSLPLKKLLGYGALDQLRDVWKSLLSALLMAGAVWAFGLLPLPLLVKLPGQIVLGAALYYLINRMLKNESLLYALSMLKKRSA